MAKEIFEAFEGQQDMFGFSQATKAGDTIYVAGTVGMGEGMHIPESMAGQMELAYRNVADTLAYFGARMSDVWNSASTSPTSTRPPPRWRSARPPTGARICQPHRWSRSASWRCPS